MAYSILHNTPVEGAIQWGDVTIQYMGENYAIADGYTNTRYAYWTPVYPNNLVVTDEYPTLGNDDCLVFVNKSGTAIVVPNSTVVSGDIIVPGSILANALAANSVTSDKIAAGAVTANAIAAGVVETNHLAANSITSNQIAANAVGAEAIAAGAILSDKIVAGAITTDKIAASAITVNEIAAGAITAEKLGANSVVADKIKAGSITTNHLAPEFGSQLVIGGNPALSTMEDAIASEIERAMVVEGELLDFTDKANAFFIFDIAEGTLSIGKTGSPFASEFSSAKLSFKQSGTEVAYLSNNKLYIKIAQILDILTVGDKSVAEGGDGFVDMDTRSGGLRASWRAS